ncbi:hypothetical protein TNCV_827611 [Trichonephila clavipes]|nr:hypothetical protein TNCV_827611 [Trichonephila clavipes]
MTPARAGTPSINIHTKGTSLTCIGSLCTTGLQRYKVRTRNMPATRLALTTRLPRLQSPFPKKRKCYRVQHILHLLLNHWHPEYETGTTYYPARWCLKPCCCIAVKWDVPEMWLE